MRITSISVVIFSPRFFKRVSADSVIDTLKVEGGVYMLQL